MNFLLRSTTHHAAEPPSTSAAERPVEVRQAAATLEGLIAEDPYPGDISPERRDEPARGSERDNDGGGLSERMEDVVVDRFSDVSEDEGFIIIPHKEIENDWVNLPHIQSLHSLDRSFVFPGEQVHILACLSASKQATEIITPFKVAAVMSRNGNKRQPEKQNGHVSNGSSEASVDGDVTPVPLNGESHEKEGLNSQKVVTDGESLLRMEDHKRQTEALLRKFKNSHFFVRIAESSEPLWSKKSDCDTISDPWQMDETQSGRESRCINAIVDKGDFDANVVGGVARNTVKCSALPNGDIVVLLQVSIVDSLKDPVIEILQFEKHQDASTSPKYGNNFDHLDKDPCGELLKWLIPLDNSLPAPSHSLSPSLSTSPGIGSTSHRSAFPATSSSQLFSFSHFRSYSMSSLPPSSTPQMPSLVIAQSSKLAFDIEEWDHNPSYKITKSQRSGTEELLSFRGVSLERERFSVRCGLEGICIPGRRWRRKVDIIQPVEIHSFSAACNADDLLCVQIKNVSPAHTPDIIIYVDAITIVYEESGKDGLPSALPIACIESGNDYSLPNLALRKGEEHSFILKPATSVGKNLKSFGEKNLRSSSLPLPHKSVEIKGNSLNAGRYAVMVSCRCNYTESRLFFKQPTRWRPSISKDLMISVASEISGQPCGSHGSVTTQLPVQVLTLQASNLTSEDLTLTVLAPTSFMSPPSVVPLNSTPSSPVSPFLGFSEFTERVHNEKHGSTTRRLNSAPPTRETNKESEGELRSVSLDENSVPDVVPSSGLSCTHLWLQSRVPLGCVPSQSTATIKLELLPLTNGIITLDTLQIDVKEKGLTYIPEHSLKINATSSISTEIL